MARKNRVRSELGIYHVYSRSIPEFNLFKSRVDKEKFMEIVRKYKEIFGFSIYSYCLMNNHYHILVKTNGSDISKIYHRINLCYAIYYNRKYKRRGSVFSERFKSKVITSNRYLKTVSLYIHRNPKAFCTTKRGFYKYEFSSLGVLLNMDKDRYRVLDGDVILKAFGGDLEGGRSNYKNVFERYFSWFKKFRDNRKTNGDKRVKKRIKDVLLEINNVRKYKNREYRLTCNKT